MLSKFLRNAVCAVGAVAVTSGIVFSAFYAYKEFVALAADIEKNEQEAAIGVIPAQHDEPVFIVTPRPAEPDSSSAVQQLERVEVVAQREVLPEEASVVQVLERVATHVFPSAQGAEGERSIPEETIEQIGKGIGGLYGAVREAEEVLQKSVDDGGSGTESARTNVAENFVVRPQVEKETKTERAPYLFEEYKLGVNAPSAVLKLRSKKFGNYRSTHSIDGFIEDVCRYSPDVMRQIKGKGCSIATLSKLQKGTVVRIPATEVFVGVPAGTEVPTSIALIPKSNEPNGSVLVPSFDMPDMASIAASEAFALSKENAELRESLSTKNGYLLFFGVSAGLFFLGMLMIAAKNHRLENQRQEMHESYIALGKELKEVQELKCSAQCGTTGGLRVPDGEPVTPNDPEWKWPLGIDPNEAPPSDETGPKDTTDPRK